MSTWMYMAQLILVTPTWVWLDEFTDQNIPSSGYWTLLILLVCTCVFVMSLVSVVST